MGAASRRRSDSPWPDEPAEPDESNIIQVDVPSPALPLLWSSPPIDCPWSSCMHACPFRAQAQPREWTIVQTSIQLFHEFAFPEGSTGRVELPPLRPRIIQLRPAVTTVPSLLQWLFCQGCSGGSPVSNPSFVDNLIAPLLHPAISDQAAVSFLLLACLDLC